MPRSELAEAPTRVLRTVEAPTRRTGGRPGQARPVPAAPVDRVVPPAPPGPTPPGPTPAVASSDPLPPAAVPSATARVIPPPTAPPAAPPEPIDPDDPASEIRDDPAPAGAAGSRLLAATGSIALATLVSRITGFVKQVLLVTVLGGAIASSFAIANTIPNMIAEAILGAVLTAIVIPALVRSEKEDPDGGHDFVRRLFTMAMVTLGLATLTAILMAPILTRIFVAEDGQVDGTLTKALIYLLLPAILFYGMSALFMAILNSRQNFKPAAWAPVLNNLVVLVVLGVYLVTPGELTLDPLRMSDPKLLTLGLGVTFGVVVQAASMLPALRREGFSLKPLWGIDDRLKAFAGSAVAVVLYVLISQAGLTVALRVAGHYDASGPIIYQQAWILLQLPYGVLGVTILTAIMPRLSRNAADDDTPGVVDDLSTALRLTVLSLVPIIVFLTYAGPMVGVALYGYGNFGAGNADRLGMAISWSAFTLIPYALVMVYLRVFYAREQAWSATWIILGITAVKIVLSLLAPQLASTPEQVVLLLGAANGVAHMAGAVVGWLLIRRTLAGMPLTGVTRTSVVVVGGSLLALALTILVDRFLGLERLDNGIGLLLRPAVCGLIMVAATVGLLRAARLPDVMALTVAVERRLGLRELGDAAPPDNTPRVAPPMDPMSAVTEVLPIVRVGKREAAPHAGTGAGSVPYPGAGRIPAEGLDGDQPSPARIAPDWNEGEAVTEDNASGGRPSTDADRSEARSGAVSTNSEDRTTATLRPSVVKKEPTADAARADQAPRPTPANGNGANGGIDAGTTRVQRPVAAPATPVTPPPAGPAPTGRPGIPAERPQAPNAARGANPAPAAPKPSDAVPAPSATPPSGPPAPPTGDERTVVTRAADEPRGRSGSARPRAPQLIPGASVAGGRYRLLASHGGARGLRFWQAMDVKLDREVALTFVDSEQQRGNDPNDPHGPQAILSRTLRLGKINSPGLARVLDVVRASSGGIVVAEWTRGRSLREMADTVPSPTGAANAIKALASAAEEAHRAGSALSIDHPDRIRISTNGDAVLAFPATLGDADSAADVRGLGAMLYALMVARWPLGDPTPTDRNPRPTGRPVGGMRAAARNRDGTVLEPRAIRPEVPFEISAVAVRALDQDSGIRTAATVAHILDQASVINVQTDLMPALRLGQRAPGSTGHALAEPQDGSDRRPTSNRTLVAMVGLGIATVLILGLLGWWLATALAGGGSSEPLTEQDIGLTTAETTPPAEPSAAESSPVTVTGAAVFSPEGTPDRAADATNVLDNNPATVWATDSYFQQFPALKEGVGLMLTLDGNRTPTEAWISSPSPGTQVSIRAAPSADPTLDETTQIGSATLGEGVTTIPLQSNGPTDHVLVWITRLSTADGRNQSTISDLGLSGT
nr:murein biosynthesis integral membrane protein MurJ [Millisia brevis]